VLVTISGTVHFTYTRSSSFSTDTTVNVFLPVITDNPTVILTALFKIAGDDNEVSSNILGITAVDTFNFTSRPRSIIDYGRSTLNIAAISNTYPALNLSPGGSGDNKVLQVTSLTGTRPAWIDGNGYEYVTRFSMGSITTPVASRAHVADPTGGGTQDAESRTAIIAVIDRLKEVGIIVPDP
jgi:hypothetical protein